MKIQHELKRPVPFETVEQEVVVNLLRIGDQLDNRLSRLFRERGLTLSRFNVLRILLLANRPLTCGEIAEGMIQVVPAITSLVDHLEQQGLVERHRCLDDRRVVHVQITPAGKKLADEALPPLAQLEHELLGHIKRSQLKSLLDLLEVVRDSIVANDA